MLVAALHACWRPSPFQSSKPSVHRSQLNLFATTFQTLWCGASRTSCAAAQRAAPRSSNNSRRALSRDPNPVPTCWMDAALEFALCGLIVSGCLNACHVELPVACLAVFSLAACCVELATPADDRCLSQAALRLAALRAASSSQQESRPSRDSWLCRTAPSSSCSRSTRVRYQFTLSIAVVFQPTVAACRCAGLERGFPCFVRFVLLAGFSTLRSASISGHCCAVLRHARELAAGLSGCDLDADAARCGPGGRGRRGAAAAAARCLCFVVVVVAARLSRCAFRLLLSLRLLRLGLRTRAWLAAAAAPRGVACSFCAL